jgi:hypothetical protein
MLNQRLSRRGLAPKTFSLLRFRLGGAKFVAQRNLRLGNFYTHGTEGLVRSAAQMVGEVGGYVRSRQVRRQVPRFPCRTLLEWRHIATDA